MNKSLKKLNALFEMLIGAILSLRDRHMLCYCLST